MIKVENVNFKYKGTEKNTLNNLNFTINDGEIVAIVGQNGSGKSTIGKLIAGIMKLKHGKIFIDDLDVSNKKDYSKIINNVGIVFQNPENQIIFNNIHDELSFCLKDLDSIEIDSRIESALKKVNMLEYKDKELYSLSLGQKQRIVIAEILAKNPKYIILDEPTTMLDTQGKEQIHTIISSLKKQGYTIICITNLADEILLADRTLILNNGTIVEEIKKEDLSSKVDILRKYNIKEPMLLKLQVELKNNGIDINLADYSVKEFSDKIKEMINNEKHI